MMLGIRVLSDCGTISRNIVEDVLVIVLMAGLRISRLLQASNIASAEVVVAFL